jgi:hypothetical protein
LQQQAGVLRCAVEQDGQALELGGVLAMVRDAACELFVIGRGRALKRNP